MDLDGPGPHISNAATFADSSGASLRSYNPEHMNRMLRVLCPILIAAPLLSRAQAPVPNEKVPVIDGGAGSCSVELTVRSADGKPVYAATVKVHVKYGFGGMRELWSLLPT